MQIFYLNLDCDTARRQSMERQLASADLPYERIQGVLGKGLSDIERSRIYSRSRALRHHCMDLSNAHIGCSMSHILAYREIAKRDLPYALILEDDVILENGWNDRISELRDIVDPARAEVILLSPAIGDFSKPSALRSTESAIAAPYVSGYYASAFIVTKPAAQSLSRELFPIDDVADCWPRVNAYRVADIWVLKDPIIHQDQHTFGSSTNADHAVLKDFRSRAMYKLRRVRCVLLDAIQSAVRRRLKPYNGVLD